MRTWAVARSTLIPVLITTLPRSKAGLPGVPPAIAGTIVVTETGESGFGPAPSAS